MNSTGFVSTLVRLPRLILLANPKMSDKLQFVAAFASGRMAQTSDKLKLESTDKSPMESGDYKIRLKRPASDPHEYWAFSRDGLFLSLQLGIGPSPVG